MARGVDTWGRPFGCRRPPGESGGRFNLGGFGGIHLGNRGTLLLIVLSFLFKTNLFDPGRRRWRAGSDGEFETSLESDESPAAKQQDEFVVFVLDDVQHTWEWILPAAGTPYRHKTLVLFTYLTQSVRGTAQSCHRKKKACRGADISERDARGAPPETTGDEAGGGNPKGSRTAPPPSEAESSAGAWIPVIFPDVIPSATNRKR